MKIEANSFAVVEYKLSDDRGVLLDDGEIPIEYVHGYGMLVPGLEKSLAGLGAGDEREILLPPDAAYGDHDEELVIEVDRSEVGKAQVDDELVLTSPDGDEGVMRVVELTEDAAILDGNHPLAGKTLRYKVRIRSVRAATEDEILAAAKGFEEAQETPDDEMAGLVQLRPTKSNKN